MSSLKVILETLRALIGRSNRGLSTQFDPAADTIRTGSMPSRSTMYRPTVGIDSLPVEVLSFIYEYAALLGSYDDINPSLVPMLMSSCAYLRYAALHTPFLWSFPIFRWYGTSDREGYSASPAVYLERSGSMDLHLQITVDSDGSQLAKLQLAIESFKILMRPYLHRCCRLDAMEHHPRSSIPLADLPPSFFPLEGNMPTLQRLTFSGYLGYPSSLLGTSLAAPRLAHIVCKGALLFINDTGYGDPRWLSAFAVETLDVLHSGQRNATGLISSLSGLTMLRCLRISTHLHSLRGTLVFPLLEVLSVLGGSFATDSQDTLGPPCIRAPNLLHLQFKRNGNNNAPAFLTDFPKLVSFQHCGPAAYIMRIRIPTYDEFERLFDMLNALPTLQAMSFCVDESSSWTRELHRLMMAKSTDPNPVHHHFPSLEHIQVCAVNNESDNRSIPLFVEMLENRPQLRATFVCGSPDTQSPTPEMEEAVQPVAERWMWGPKEDFVDRFFNI